MGIKRVDPANRMVGNACEHVAQGSFRVQGIQLRRTDEAVDRRRTLASAVGACKQVILSTKCDRAERAFHIVVDLDLAIIAGPDKRRRHTIMVP